MQGQQYRLSYTKKDRFYRKADFFPEALWRGFIISVFYQFLILKITHYFQDRKNDRERDYPENNPGLYYGNSGDLAELDCS